MPQILEQNVAGPHGRHEEIRVSVIVDIGEGRGHADPGRHGDAGALGNILELSSYQVAPQTIRAELIDEVDVLPAVSIHIRHREAAAVIVMYAFIEPAGILHHRMAERNSTLRVEVRETELMKDDAAVQAQL